MSVPPYACAAVLTIAVGYAADRSRQRGQFNILVSLIGIVGFAMQIASRNPHVSFSSTSQYAGSRDIGNSFMDDR